jgi:cytochrome P450
MAEATLATNAATGRGLGWLHALWCFLMRSPMILRGGAWVLRKWPIASHWLPIVAQRDAVVAAFLRSATFSNTAHAPNLVAGQFSIGMQEGPRYRSERATLEAMLRTPDHLGRASAVFTRSRLEAFNQPGSAATFDLVDDYLGPIAWRAMKRCFGVAGDALATGHPGSASPEDTEKQLFLTLRHVASHLVVGAVATPAVQCRAESAGAALNQRVHANKAVIQEALANRVPGRTDAAIHRNTVGLMWVSHPVAVQAGVHLMVELLKRDTWHTKLRQQAAAAGDNAWLDAALRLHVRNVILELLRFRPPFPIVVRDVPRGADFAAGDRRPAKAPAGQSMKLMVIGAMFDPDAVDQPGKFMPDRKWKHEDDRYMVFGHGDRSCPGREHVLEMLTSMVIGLLLLPRQVRHGKGKKVVYDGPAAAHMPLVF